MAQLQKQKDPELWLMHKRNGQASSASIATLRGQSVSSGTSLVHNNAGPSLGPGGRRLKTVDAGSRGLFEEDDEEGVDGEIRRKREREMGQEGDIDEMEYEDDFADDDEKMEPEGALEDEEAKEIEVCCIF
jgi:transcription initiation factor TFIIF subunit alpha